MINATTNSSNNSQSGGSPMPTPPVADTKPPETAATPTTTASATPTPETPTKSAEAMMPPKVLPSHAAPHTHAVKPGVAPHQDIAGLHKSLSDKINDSKPSEPAKAAQSDSVPPPPSIPEQPTIDTQVTPPPKKGGLNLKLLIGVLLFLIVATGAGVGYYLQQQNQDVSSRAAYYDNSEIKSGLSVTITSQPNSSADSYYKPASENVSDASRFYDQSKGERVEFTVPVRNLQKQPISDKYQLLAFKIDTATVNGQEVPITENSPYSEQQIYDIHKGSDNKFNGTKQSLKYSSGWKEFTVQPGEQKMISGSWLPSSADCGMYQLDMQIESAVGDQIVGVGMVRVKNCQQPQTKISGSVVCYDNGQSYAVTNATVNVKDKNFTTDGNGIYTSDSYEKDTFIASRLTLPQQLNLKNTKTGETMTVPSSGVKINAFNGCDANFMNGNCGGITTERQTQCSNAPKDSSGKPMPNSYEWCKLAGGTENRTGFDFALSGCVAPPPSVPPTTPPTPKACNELCSPIDPNSCAPGANGTIKCVSTPQGEHRCRDTRFASQANCQAPVTPPPTTPPTGGMCVNLCGVGSASSATPDMSVCTSIGGVHNQPKLNEYLHLKCNVSGTPSQVNIMLTKPNGAETKINTNNNPTASYKIDVAGTYSARCEVINTTGGGSTPSPITTTPPPTSKPTGTTNPTLSCASIGGTCKSRCSGTETPQNVLGCAGEGRQSMVCCATVSDR